MAPAWDQEVFLQRFRKQGEFMKLINKNLSEFMELNIDKSIICFGAGKLFQDMFITMDNCF